MDRRSSSSRIGEDHHELTPGATPDYHQLFYNSCSSLCHDLEHQERECVQLEHLLSQVQENNVTSAISDLSTTIDVLISESEDLRLERYHVQKGQQSLHVKIGDLENRCKQLQTALDRASKFDEERLDALQNSERCRGQLQAELDSCRCRVSELESIQRSHLSELSSLQQQVTKQATDLDILRKDYYQVVDVNRHMMEENRQASQQITKLQHDLDQLNQRYSSVERDNVHLNQALTLSKHSQMSLENELAQTRRQLVHNDKMLASTQKSLDKAVENRRKTEKITGSLEKKVQERDAQISKLRSSLRQLRAFFHAIENMDAGDAAANPSAPKKPFQFGRILQELDKLSTSVEGL